MNTTEVALDIIARISGADRGSLRPEQELVADLNLDSAKALELLVELEDRFNIEIDDEDATRLNTVGGILAYLERVDAIAG